MRKEFATWIAKKSLEREDLIFFTGDLGFQALERVRDVMGPRFINAGVSEQNMVSMAAAFAQQGLLPFCYSIAPFIVFRAAEQIRLDVCIHSLNVKIVGNGGGYGYGIMGPTHHALEDLAVLSSFAKMKCFVPLCSVEVENTCEAMLRYPGPSYLRLGVGVLPSTVSYCPEYQDVKKIASGDSCTIVGIGPVVLNAVLARDSLRLSADIFAINEFPLLSLNSALKESLSKTGKLLIVEEHVRRGGLGENISLLLLEHKISVEAFHHSFAIGYIDGLYGDQTFHQRCSRLDVDALKTVLTDLVYG